MEEVSARVFSFYAETVVRRGGNVDALTGGLRSLERLRDGAKWYDWRDHVRMLERFEASIGGAAEADRAALEANERRVAEPLRVFARSIADLRLLYRAGFWFAGSLYRHLRFSVQSRGELLEIEIEIPGPHETSDIFFRMWRGTLRGTPRLIGLPDATVASEIGPRRGVFTVLLPEGKDVFARARGAVRSAWTGGVLLRHLEKHESDLRSAYDALLRSRQDFREIGHSTPDALMLLRDGAIVYANPAASAAIGSRTLAEAVKAADRPEVEAWLAEAQRRGATGRLEFRVASRIFEAEAARAVELSGGEAILVVARDVSARHAAEDLLRRSERDKEALLEAVPDIIVRIGDDGTVIDVAGQTSHHRMGGILRGRIGQSLDSMAELLAELPTGFAERLTRGAAAARPDAFVVETPAQIDGQPICLEWRGVATDGEGTVCLVRDLSHQRRIEAELAVAERLASLGMLAAGVGHEINNPLTYLLLQLRMLERALAEGRSGPDLSAHLTAALEGAGHIERVVRSLKALAQREPQVHHPVDVNGVVDEMMRLTENRVQAGTRLVLHQEPGVFALADEGPLGQVFANVFVNAADARAELDEPGEIRIAVRTRGDWVEIEVSDDGPGMPATVLAHAFDPFFTTKPASRGGGLGLTLAHRIITALGGSVTLAPALPRGTTVTIRVPAAERPARADLDPPAREIRAGVAPAASSGSTEHE